MWPGAVSRSLKSILHLKNVLTACIDSTIICNTSGIRWSCSCNNPVANVKSRYARRFLSGFNPFFNFCLAEERELERLERGGVGEGHASSDEEELADDADATDARKKKRQMDGVSVIALF